MRTISKIVQDAWLDILEEDIDDLTIDDRIPKFGKELPEAFDNSSFPIIVVMYPTLQQEEKIGGNYDRQRYELELMLVDESAAIYGTDEGKERLNILLSLIKKSLAARQNWGLAYLLLHGQNAEWSIPVFGGVGNNQLALSVTIQFVVTVERGKTLD
jgi:hypothetical protein